MRALGAVEAVRGFVGARVRGVGAWVGHLGGFAEAAGVDAVGEADGEGGGCGEEDVAIEFEVLVERGNWRVWRGGGGEGEVRYP